MRVLDLRGVKKGFLAAGGGRRLVLDISEFSMEAGEETALHGPSGSGKTTLLHLIAGLLLPDEGSITVADQRCDRLDEAGRDRLRGRAIGMVHQLFYLLPGFTALENVELAMRFGGGLDRARAMELLRRVGLADRAQDRPARLSAGQMQRVALARALANRPRLVLADEPTANLDPVLAGEAMTLLRETCRESGAALLLVSHDERVTDGFARRLDLDQINRAAAGRLR